MIALVMMGWQIRNDDNGVAVAVGRKEVQRLRCGGGGQELGEGPGAPELGGSGLTGLSRIGDKAWGGGGKEWQDLDTSSDVRREREKERALPSSYKARGIKHKNKLSERGN